MPVLDIRTVAVLGGLFFVSLAALMAYVRFTLDREANVSARTEARLSHGICPRCEERAGL
jgi:hypothetical protein